MVTKPGTDERGYLVSIGDNAPDFSMEYVTGEKVSLSELKGKVVVLQFTAIGAQFVDWKCHTSKKMYGTPLKIKELYLLESIGTSQKKLY